eukprot:GHVS01033371.1.p1 GENE.GHVS01033371.1~~GHVS01033371.1.p1  ORF type:complete len:538 (-),score=94.06 GHVS01033371.1:235-1848(-)
MSPPRPSCYSPPPASSEGRVIKAMVQSRRAAQCLLAGALGLTAFVCWQVIIPMCHPSSSSLSAPHSTSDVFSTVPVSVYITQQTHMSGEEAYMRLLTSPEEAVEETEDETVETTTDLETNVTHVFYNPNYGEGEAAEQFGQFLEKETHFSLGDRLYVVKFYDTAEPNDNVMQRLLQEVRNQPEQPNQPEEPNQPEQQTLEQPNQVEEPTLESPLLYLAPPHSTTFTPRLIVLLVEEDIQIVNSTIQTFRKVFQENDVMFGGIPLGKGNTFAWSLGWTHMEMVKDNQLIGESWSRLLRVKEVVVYPRQLTVEVHDKITMIQKHREEDFEGKICRRTLLCANIVHEPSKLSVLHKLKGLFNKWRHPRHHRSRTLDDVVDRVTLRKWTNVGTKLQEVAPLEYAKYEMETPKLSELALLGFRANVENVDALQHREYLYTRKTNQKEQLENPTFIREGTDKLVVRPTDGEHYGFNVFFKGTREDDTREHNTRVPSVRVVLEMWAEYGVVETLVLDEPKCVMIEVLPGYISMVNPEKIPPDST